MTILSGTAHPLGATHRDGGTNFALFSAHASRVELCLFDDRGKAEIARYELPEKTCDVWHGFIPGVAPGACYGYRVHGPYEPRAGHRFDSNKLLLDPYARAMRGQFQWHASQFSFATDEAAGQDDLQIFASDNQAHMPKGVVTAQPDHDLVPACPLVPWEETLILEAHVKGFTQLHPGVPEAARGTFEGLCQPAVIDYIKSLGVTAVELLPIHAFIDEYHLQRKELKNYWGYNTLNFFTPHAAYLGSGDPGLFRRMVDRFHDAGLEVLLDVVYNHTCEGDHHGPTLSFKGIDNASYYQLLPADRRFYINDSGCGNTIGIRHPRVLQLVMDSLRYWVQIMGVDGFRFDLASVLGREANGFNAHSAFFQSVAQDPVLSRVKLIAEPWDLGPGGYQLGGFPPGWSEWNDRYRDTVRRFWRGDVAQLPELARRLHGSADIFEHAGRKPSASINFVTSHDGFCLRDLVSYRHRQNQANQEDNEDGHRGNFSANHGVEGETTDPQINAIRWRQQRNMLATLLLSQGVPMIPAGDESGRTQRGNNNAYCQDNPISWIDWANIGREGRALTDTVRKLAAVRKTFPVLSANIYRHKRDSPKDGSIRWVNSDGKSMREEHWHEHELRVLGYLLSQPPVAGETEGRQLLVIFNAATRQQGFALPETTAKEWHTILDTARPETAQADWWERAPGKLSLCARSVVILVSGDAAHLPLLRLDSRTTS